MSAQRRSGSIVRGSALRRVLIAAASLATVLAIGVTVASGFGFVSTFGHSGSGNGALDTPNAVDTDSSGNIYVADRDNNRVEKFSSSGQFIKVFGTSGPGLLSQPRGIAVGPSDNVYVADTFHDQIVKFDSNGTYLTKWGSFGTTLATQFNEPYGVHVTSSFVYVADFGNSRVTRFDLNGGSASILVNSADDASIGNIQDITTDTGNIYTADSGNDQIRKYQLSNGSHITNFGSNGTGNGQFNDPWGISYDGSGSLWVADSQNSRIQEISTAGTFRLKWGGLPGGTCNKELNFPEGIEAVGNDVLVADTLNDRIVRLGDAGNANPSCHGGGSGGAAKKCSGKKATIVGTVQADTLTGTPGPDVAVLSTGNDKFNGKGGNDVVCGEGGNDKLIGKAGKDRLLGQAGKDKLKGGAGGGDVCNGGAGKADTAAGSCETVVGVP